MPFRAFPILLVECPTFEAYRFDQSGKGIYEQTQT